MISFVPAKINIGLDIVSRRKDGYHNLETLFYPIGLHNGTPACPSPFGDILEITPLMSGSKDVKFIFTGNRIDCPLEKNLVVKAYRLFADSYFRKTGNRLRPYCIHLEKHIPDGAGIGGGSADATFTLKALNSLSDEPFTIEEMSDMALRLGADCPFFLYNEPMRGSGVGEILTPFPAILSGKWLLLVKPDIYISTGEAFAGISPKEPEMSLLEKLTSPLEEWKGQITNDFEESLSEKFSEIKEIINSLYDSGAIYASMSGSGSACYGIYADSVACHAASELMKNYLPNAGVNEILL